MLLATLVAALPTYQTLLNTFEGCDDPNGDTQNAWARWSRGWTSEENRHGDLLNKYLYLGGRCDMRKVEETIQHLITSGFNPGAEQDPYRGFVYTSFQVRKRGYGVGVNDADTSTTNTVPMAPCSRRKGQRKYRTGMLQDSQRYEVSRSESTSCEYDTTLVLWLRW